jgi:hypothetical protein
MTNPAGMPPQERSVYVAQRIPQLPKWAQEHIAALEREKSHLQWKLDNVEKRAAASDPFVIVGYGGEPDLAIPRNSCVKIRIGEGWNKYVSMRIEWDRHGQKPVAAWIESGSTIKIMPRSGNCFLAMPDEH